MAKIGTDLQKIGGDFSKYIPQAFPPPSPTFAVPTTKPQMGSSSPLSIPVPSSEDTPGDIVVVGKRDNDYRVRLRSLPGGNVLGDRDPANVLNPLFETNGLVFPYTPTIQFSQDVDWKSVDLVHTNFDVAAYSKTPSATISLTGKFTSQTHGEGRYTLAALHFLRVVSKMYFGKEDAQTNKAGLPPPTLLFSGYGPYMYNDLKVHVKNHSYTFDDNVDTIPIICGDGSVVRLPVILIVSLSLQIVQSPSKQRNEFNLDKFRSGELMKRGGWI